MARKALDRPPRAKRRQRRARRRPCRRPRRDRHRDARRRRAAERARPASRRRRSAAGSPRCRKASGPKSCSPRLMSAPGRPPRRSARRAASTDDGAPADRRRAAARARVRRVRPADHHRHPRRSIPTRPSTRPARQILPPPARRRELGRRDPAPAERARHDQPPPCRPAGADRLPPGRRAVLALHPRGAGRGADPGDRQGGRRRQLRRLRI